MTEDLLTYAEHIRKTWSIPCMNIAVRSNQDARTFGLGDGRMSGQVDANTLFPYMSCSKLFTAVALGLLVDEGKLTWDTKIIAIIPAFSMREKACQDRLTISHALSHRSGLAPDLVGGFVENGGLPEVLRIIASLDCTLERAGSVTYNNHMFALLGYVVEAISGTPFVDFVQKRIFEQLGMDHTTYDPAALDDSGVPAFTLIDGDAKEAGWWHAQSGQGLPPSGGLISNAKDMCKWLQCLMNASSHEKERGETLLGHHTWKEILRGRGMCGFTLGFDNMDGQAAYDDLSPPLYAYGLTRFHYRGIDVAAHTGTGPGGAAVLLWTPGRDFGISIAVSTMYEGVVTASIIAFRALELHFGMTKTADWEKRARNIEWLPFKPATIPSIAQSNLATLSAESLYGEWRSDTFPPLIIRACSSPIDDEDDSAVAQEDLKMEASFVRPPVFMSYIRLKRLSGDMYWGESRLLTRPRNGTCADLPSSAYGYVFAFRQVGRKLLFTWHNKYDSTNLSSIVLADAAATFGKVVEEQ